MRIALIARSSLYTVRGGDTTQILQTAAGLKDLGVDTEIFLASDIIEYQGFDLLHFFNVIRPSDHLYHIRRSRKPYVLSTIYLDYSSFDRFGRNALQRTVFRILGRSGAEYLKNVYRFSRGQDKLVSREYLLGHLWSVKRLVRHAAMLLPNSQSEYKRISADTGINVPFTVIPNGIEEPDAPRQPF